LFDVDEKYSNAFKFITGEILPQDEYSFSLTPSFSFLTSMIQYFVYFVNKLICPLAHFGILNI
jgi:hypothetical protein